MANTKHSVAREIVIDRLLHERCGYSIYDMLEIVNRELELHGFREVTINTIRNDIENIQYLYKQKLDIFKQGNRYFYRYHSERSTIFNNVLTNGELQHLHSALMSIRFVDPIQGTMMYKEMSQRMSGILDIDSASDPIVIYKRIPSKSSCNRFRNLYDCIRKKSPILVTYKDEKGEGEDVILVHPYYIMLDCPNYYLLCRDATHNKPAKLLVTRIIHITNAVDVDYIPNKDFPLEDFYAEHLSMV